MIWTFALDRVIDFIYWIFNELPGPYNPFESLGLAVLELYQSLEHVFPTIRLFFSYAAFFLPFQHLEVLFSVIVTILFIRIIIAAIKVLWDVIPVL